MAMLLVLRELMHGWLLILNRELPLEHLQILIHEKVQATTHHGRSANYPFVNQTYASVYR